MTSSLIILMSDESASKATKLGYGQLAKTEADVQHTTAENEKTATVQVSTSQINLEVRKRSTIEIERDNGPSVRSLAFAPPQMTSRHAEKETQTHRTRREMSPPRAGSLTTRQGVEA